MLIWHKATSFTHVNLYKIPIKCSKAEITVVKRKKDEITTTCMIYKILHRKLKIERRNIIFATIFNDIYF